MSNDNLTHTHFVDKSRWAERGPWDDEPDRIEWRDESTGLPCLIVRGPSGALCGYVGVSSAHPYHGKNYNDVDDIEVHGGLTYSKSCNGRICHIPQPGEEESVWWFGFDCAHSFDVCPGFASGFFREGSYRTVKYVRGHVTALARQLKAVVAEEDES